MTFLCPRCFSNNGLKRRIIEARPEFASEKCTFHPSMKGIPVEYVANIVDDVFRNNYEIGSYNSMLGEYSGSDLQDVLFSITGAETDDVVDSVIKQLIEDDPYWPPDGEEAFYSLDASYVRSYEAFNGHSRLWEEFCESIVHEQRFFNDRAKELLAEIFDRIHLQRSSPIYAIRPGTPQSRFYRVRVVDDYEQRRTIGEDVPTHMGPPPARLRRPGRMNPSGIAALYAGFDLDTCVAEMRPSVGSAIVSAQFEITAPLWVLDTTRFSGGFKEPNLFSKDHIRRTAQRNFMRRFVQEIARPISPRDEHLDYIPTQAVAEYLLNHHQFEIGGAKRGIEAIIYRSAQHPSGKNIVVLGDASVIEPVSTPKKAKSSNLDDSFDELFSRLPRLSRYGNVARLRFKAESLNELVVREASFKAVPNHESDHDYDDVDLNF